MRPLPPVLAGHSCIRIAVAALTYVFSVQLLMALSPEQIDLLLERYERGIQEDRFRFYPGKSITDVESALRSGDLKRIRSEVLYPTAIETGETRDQDSGWGEGGFTEDAGWGQDDDSAWVGGDATSDPNETFISALLQQIALATSNCEYTRVRELADSILQLDEDNEWIQANYDEIVRWEEKAKVYTAALQEAYQAMEADDFDTLVDRLKVAYANAASKCGQDTVVQQLIDQAAESSRLEREAAIAQARQEGALHQQTFAEREAQRNAELERRQQSRAGMARGLMGLIGTATQVATLRQGGMSTSDALQQTLQQQVLTSNPQLAQTLGQVQQMQGLAEGARNGNLPIPTNTGTGIPNLPGLGGGGTGLGGGTFTGGSSGGTSGGPQISAACRALFDKAQRIGMQMKPIAERYMATAQNDNISDAERQRMAAQISMMARQQIELVNQMKANGCPGVDQIPTYNF